MAKSGIPKKADYLPYWSIYFKMKLCFALGAIFSKTNVKQNDITTWSFCTIEEKNEKNVMFFLNEKSSMLLPVKSKVFTEINETWYDELKVFTFWYRKRKIGMSQKVNRQWRLYYAKVHEKTGIPKMPIISLTAR